MKRNYFNHWQEMRAFLRIRERVRIKHAVSGKEFGFYKRILKRIREIERVEPRYVPIVKNGREPKTDKPAAPSENRTGNFLSVDGRLIYSPLK